MSRARPDVRQVEAFLAVADELHFGRAGERLLLSTSQVSQLVSAFERQLGGALFHRTSRRVELTALGMRLLARVRPAYEGLADAIDSTARDAARAGGVLRVGLPGSLRPDVGRAAAQAFEERHAMPVEYRRYSMWDAGRPDPADRWDVFVTLAFGELTWGAGLASGPVIREVPRLALMGRAHPLARQRSVDAEELADHAVLTPPAAMVEREGPYVAAMVAEWVPRTTPAGRELKLVEDMQLALFEELSPRLVRGDVLHLTVDLLNPELIGHELVGRPVHGLPPAQLRAIWPTGGPNAAPAEAFAREVAGIVPPA